MPRFLSTVLLITLAVTALSSCARKTVAPAAEQGYIRVEPASKSAPNKLAVQQGANQEAVGIDFYPGATVNKSGLVEGPKGRVSGAELQTQEPYTKVVTFYRSKYAAQGPSLKTLEEPSGTVTMLNWQDLHGNYTVIIKRDNVGKRTVVTLAKTSK